MDHDDDMEFLGAIIEAEEKQKMRSPHPAIPKCVTVAEEMRKAGWAPEGMEQMQHDKDILMIQQWHMEERDVLREQLSKFRESLQQSHIRETLLSEQVKRNEDQIKASFEKIRRVEEKIVEDFATAFDSHFRDLAAMRETFSLIIADVDRVTVLLDDPNEDSRVSVAEILGDIRMRAHARVYEINEQTDAFYKESEDNII